MPRHTDRPFVRRHSLRLEGYDYALPGAHFITVCTKNRLPLFGKIVNGHMRLNSLGEIDLACWTAIPLHFPQRRPRRARITPDHVHGIVTITCSLQNQEETREKLAAQARQQACRLPTTTDRRYPLALTAIGRCLGNGNANG